MYSFKFVLSIYSYKLHLMTGYDKIRFIFLKISYPIGYDILGYSYRHDILK